MTKVVINRQFGGFSLSQEAYEWLIAHGVRVARYAKQERNPETGLYLEQPLNEGAVIFDRTLTPVEEYDEFDKIAARDNFRLMGRYWETFIRENTRTWPLLVQCVKELGEKANGRVATLEIIEVPDDVDWYIHEYDGLETIYENHRSWPND